VVELARDVKRLEAEKQTLQIACSTISTAAVALAMILAEAGVQSAPGEVLIPQEFIEKATDARIALDEHPSGVRVRISTRVERDFAIGD